MTGYYVSLTREDGEVRDDASAGSLKAIREEAKKLVDKMAVGDCVMIFSGDGGEDEDDEGEEE